MLFTSIEFLFLFLPVVLAGYFLLPFRHGLKNLWLLAASLLFYAWGKPTFVFVMLGSIAFNYLMALLIGAARERKGAASAVLSVAVAGNLAVIGLWKYANFATATLRGWFPSLQGAIPQTSFVLPIGISFFTFQAMSYVVDVFRGTVRVQRNPLKLALYIALFPQLIAGPIVRYSTVCEQIESRCTTLDMFARGIMRFLYGFNKKMLLANLFAAVADKAFGMSDPGCGMAWLGAACYTLQIFFDFSGYSDMAIGLGLVFGFRFLENFDYPYVSRTVTEFWRRWHMTMGRWMRDYIFYPLTLSKSFTNLGRKSRNLLGQFAGKRLPAFVAMFIVYFAVGFWHGADWKYIAYGVWNGVFIMSGILLENVYNKARHLCGIEETAVTWRLFRILRTLVLVSFGRFFSRANDLKAALEMFSRSLKDCQDITFLTNGSLIKLGLDTANWILLCLTLLLLFYVESVHEKGISLRRVFARQPIVFRWIIYIGAILFILIFGCYGPEYNAASFIYEQF